MSDKYNGWTNYETWNIKLWIDNEENRYRHWQRMVENACERHSEMDDPKHEAMLEIAEQLKDHHLERVDQVTEAGLLNPSSAMSLCGWQCDILTAAVQSTNWFEIAESWVEDYYE